MGDMPVTLYTHSGILSCDGAEVQLSPQETTILETLAHHPGFFVSLDRLLLCVYDDREPSDATSSIRVAIHHLRRKILPLSPFGCRIESKHGTGYRAHPKIEIVKQ